MKTLGLKTLNTLQHLRKDLPITLVMIIGLFAFRYSIAEPYIVPTGSMEPTILPGDRLIVLKFAYDLKLPFTDLTLKHIREPARGDVVVFKYPVDPTINFVKRLIGLPGDEVVISDGFISINGVELPLSPSATHALPVSQISPKTFYYEASGKAPYRIQRLPHLARPEALHLKVPANSYFFMGDNRDNSNDSREWGFVPRSYLKGKAAAVWMSLDFRGGWIPDVRWNRFGVTL